MKVLKLLLIFILFFGTFSYAQSFKQKKGRKHHLNNPRLRKPLFRWVTGDYSKQGIQFSFGPTYTLTNPESPTGSYRSITGDTLVKYMRDPKSKLGIFAEIGMTHIVSRPSRFIHYFDWGIGLKYIGGGEFLESNIYTRDTLRSTLKGHSEFYNGYVYGRFDVHSIFQINPYLFLDNSIGVNGDYAIKIGNQSYQGFHNPNTQQFQGNINVQLHYSIGLGIKPNPEKGFFFIPSIAAPILGVYEWHGGTPSIFWFSSRYYPIQLRLKFVFLFKKKASCPPVETNSQDRKAAQQYRNR